MTKENNTRRALLASVISLLLCVAMLIGSTFAWFTDNATTNVNTIQAGELDVMLMMEDENGDWVKAEGETLKFKTADGRDAADLFWEPGCTYELPALKIVNDGNLALKFKAIVSNITGDTELADVLDVKISTDGVNFAKIGTLTELIADPDGFAYGFVLPKDKKIDTTEATPEEQAITSEYQTAEYTIALHMQETAGNTYQKLKLENMAVTVYATQYSYEKDSYSDEYDECAKYDTPPAGNWDDNASDAEADIKEDAVNKTVEIYTAAGLAQFEKNVNSGTTSYTGYTVTLEDDIDLSGHFWTPIGQTGAAYNQFKGTFDGNGKTISNMYIDSSSETGENYATGLFGWVEVHASNATIKDLTIDAANVSGNHYVGAVAGYVGGNLSIQNCKVNNSSITAVGAGDKAGAVVGYMNSSNTVTNCSASNCAVTAGRDAGQIVGCLTSNHSNVSGCTATNVTVSATGEGTGANINNDIIGRTK